MHVRAGLEVAGSDSRNQELARVQQEVYPITRYLMEPQVAAGKEE